jgi:hypothetical protein
MKSAILTAIQMARVRRSHEPAAVAAKTESDEP